MQPFSLGITINHCNNVGIVKNDWNNQKALEIHQKLHQPRPTKPMSPTDQQISHTPKNINSNNGDEDNIFPMSSFNFQHHQDNRSFNPILQKEINKVVESGKEKKEKMKKEKRRLKWKEIEARKELQFPALITC